MAGTYMYSGSKRLLIDPKVYTGTQRRDVQEIYAYSSGTRRLVWFRQPLELAAVAPAWYLVNLTITPPGTGADSFVLTRDGATIYSGTGTTYSDTGRSPATGYTYSVTAIRGGTNIAVASTSIVTPAVGSSGMTASNAAWDRMTLTWAPVTGGTVDNYVLMRGSTQVAQGASLTTFTDIGLNENTIYSWSMRAMRGAEVIASDSVNASTSIRALPTLASSAILWDRATLTWTDPAGGGVDEYRLTRGGVTVYSGGTAKTFTDIGLVASATYPYVVTAYRAGTAINSSTATSVTTPARADMGLTATVSAWDTIALAWTDTSGGSVDTYKVKRGTTEIHSGTTATKSKSDTGLMPATAYSYTLEAYRSGALISSDTASATTSAYADLGLSASSPVYHQIALTWSAKSGSIDRFLLYRSDGTLLYNGLGTSYTDGGLAASSGYSYSLYAQRSEVTIQSDTASATTQARPTSGGSVYGPALGSGYGWTQSTGKTLTGPNWTMPVNGYVTAWNMRCTGYGATGHMNPHLGGNYAGDREIGATGAGSPGWADVGVPNWYFGAGTYSSGLNTGGNSAYKSQWQPYTGASYSSYVALGQVNYWYYTASWVTKEGVHLSTHTDSWCDETGSIVYERVYDQETGALVNESGERPEHVPPYEGERMVGATWHDDEEV